MSPIGAQSKVTVYDHWGFHRALVRIQLPDLHGSTAEADDWEQFLGTEIYPACWGDRQAGGGR